MEVPVIEEKFDYVTFDNGSQVVDTIELTFNHTFVHADKNAPLGGFSIDYSYEGRDSVDRFVEMRDIANRMEAEDSEKFKIEEIINNLKNVKVVSDSEWTTLPDSLDFNRVTLLYHSQNRLPRLWSPVSFLTGQTEFRYHGYNPSDYAVYGGITPKNYRKVAAGKENVENVWFRGRHEPKLSEVGVSFYGSSASTHGKSAWSTLYDLSRVEYSLTLPHTRHMTNERKYSCVNKLTIDFSGATEFFIPNRPRTLLVIATSAIPTLIKSRR